MKINYQKLYEKLGCLFYAIASADENVRKAEEQNLKQEINDIWLPLESSTDEFGTDVAQYIFISFDYLHANDAEPEVAFRQFEDFYKAHEAQIDSSLKKRITQTAEAVADAFSGKNHAESNCLERLKQLMGK